MPHLLIYSKTYLTDEIVDGEVDGATSEDVHDCTPDEFDCEDGVTAVDKAVEYLTNEGITAPSSSEFYPRVWWSYADGAVITDYYTGKCEEKSAHLEGFTDDEARAIYARVTTR